MALINTMQLVELSVLNSIKQSAEIHTKSPFFVIPGSDLLHISSLLRYIKLCSGTEFGRVIRESGEEFDNLQTSVKERGVEGSVYGIITRIPTADVPGHYKTNVPDEVLTALDIEREAISAAEFPWYVAVGGNHRLVILQNLIRSMTPGFPYDTL